MKKIVYFHGYGSSAKSDKVDRIKRFFGSSADVFAYDINVDPSIAEFELYPQIMDMLLDDVNSQDELIFIGTSLGAYWAYDAAQVFGAKCVLLNPSLDPFNSLQKYGVSSEIRHQYFNYSNESNFYKKCKVYLAENDEVIDFTKFSKFLSTSDVTMVKNETHRFNGEAFEMVLSEL
jgi:predicted esterase YcpF (UPF0227 family)